MIASGPKQELFEQPRTIRAARLTACKNIAPAELVDETTVSVPQWNNTLAVDARDFETLTYVGIRAHHLKLVDPHPNIENIFPCWLLETSESQHELTLYLHLRKPPQALDTPHLQMEILKDEWQMLKLKPLPWHVWLPPQKLLLLND